MFATVQVRGFLFLSPP